MPPVAVCSLPRCDFLIELQDRTQGTSTPTPKVCPKCDSPIISLCPACGFLLFRPQRGRLRSCNSCGENIYKCPSLPLKASTRYKVREILSNFTGRFRELREHQLLSRNSLETLAGLRPGMVSRIECGLSTPSVKQLAIMSSILNIEMNNFFEPPNQIGVTRNSVTSANSGLDRASYASRSQMVPSLGGPNQIVRMAQLPPSGPPDSNAREEVSRGKLDHSAEAPTRID
jgi:ribosome-binding protein aMBF1 (putative translation factor)